MWTDPIVEEVRREREAHAEHFGFDVAAICGELRRLQEQESNRSLVAPPEAPRRQDSPAV
jgi:hypothetical protein